jgi:phage-related protein
MKYFVIDESVNSLSNLGLRIAQPPVLPASQQIVVNISVDGREGTLTLRKGWEDLTFSFSVAVMGANFRTSWRTIMPQILAASTIYFSNDNTVLYKVKTVKAGNLEQKLTSMGVCQLTFICAPFRYLCGVAMITKTATSTIANPGTVYSLPRIKVYGTGSRTLTINGKPIILNLLSGNLTLDSELKECFYGDVAQNQNMSGDFPIFNVGNNTVTLGTGITKVEIEPRWRFL